MHRRRKLMCTSRWILRRKIDAYKMTGAQKSHEYEMTGAQKKIDAYKMKGSQKIRE